MPISMNKPDPLEPKTTSAESPAHRRTERRVLALDVGGQRIGVAMSDAHGLFAAPLLTVKAEPRARAFERIAGLIWEHTVDEIVVGLPLTLRGEIGPQAQLIQSFTTELEKMLRRTAKGPIPSIHFFDERLTSVAAEQMLRELGVKPEKRKERIDEIAASIILQDYLDCIRTQSTDAMDAPPFPG